MGDEIFFARALTTTCGSARALIFASECGPNNAAGSSGVDEKRHFASEWLLLIIVFALLAYLGVAGGSEVVTWAERPRAGSLAELSDDRRLLRIASDEKTLEQATKAEAAKDEPSLNELLRAEKFSWFQTARRFGFSTLAGQTRRSRYSKALT